MEAQDFNVFVAAETGLFKGINVNRKQVIAKNLNSLQSLDRQQEITCMAWGNEDESEILLGLRNQTVKIYDTEFKGFSGSVETPIGEGPLRGVGKVNGAIVTAAESGHVKFWRFGSQEQIEIDALNAGENLSRMRVSPYNTNLIATGGKKNDLQIWDLEKPENPTFKAKNVKHDFLDLPVPIWVSDLAFVPNSEQVVTCSRHGQVRLYDPKTNCRRPIVTCKPEDEAWTCISVSSRPNQIVIGSGKGRCVLFDFRQMQIIHAYRGYTGSIRQVICHPEKPYVVSVGLDRFVRVHHLSRQTPIFKTYLKSRLNSVLIRKDFDIEMEEEEPQAETEVAEDPLWKDMEVIRDRVLDEDDGEEVIPKDVFIAAGQGVKTTLSKKGVKKTNGNFKKMRKVEV